MRDIISSQRFLFDNYDVRWAEFNTIFINRFSLVFTHETLEECDDSFDEKARGNTLASL